VCWKKWILVINFLHTVYKYVLNSVVKISLMFAQYFEYHAIILRGPLFCGHAVQVYFYPQTSAICGQYLCHWVNHKFTTKIFTAQQNWLLLVVHVWHFLTVLQKFNSFYKLQHIYHWLSDDSWQIFTASWQFFHCQMVMFWSLNAHVMFAYEKRLSFFLNKRWIYEVLVMILDAVLLVLLLHPFNGLFSRTTSVSRHQKGKPFWILLEQEMMGLQWH